MSFRPGRSSVAPCRKVAGRSGGHLERGVVGGHSRQAVDRREPGDAHAARHAVRVDDGAGGFAGEADGDSLAAESQRPGDHAQQQAEAGGVKTAKDVKPLADKAKAAGEPLTFAMTFPPGTHAMWIALLAGVGRHSSRQGRHSDHDSAAADGRQHEGGQDGRLLRRRAVEQPRHRRRHRLHGDHDAADVARPSGKGVRVHRRVRDEEPQDRQGGAEGAAPGERAPRQAGQPRQGGGGRGAADLHQLPAGDHPRSGCSATTTTATAGRSRTSTT